MKKNLEEWENAYLTDSCFHKNEYPSELIVGFIRRNFTSKIHRQERGGVKILELGCGWGNNMRFVKNEGFDVYGIDFSSTAIKRLKKLFPGKVYCCDFIKIPFPDNNFDLIYDRSSIQHNNKNDIFKIHTEVYRTLKKGGKFFSIMLKEGNNGFLTGYLTENELRYSLRSFRNLKIDYLIRTENNTEDKLISYIIEAVK